MNTYEQLYKLLNYQFRDESLLTEALTHCSAVKTLKFHKDYERLEFLGDSVLSLVITTILLKEFPDEAEGDLARRRSSLINASSLLKIANTLDLASFVNLSSQEISLDSLQHTHILSDIVESIIGALFLDGGLEPCIVFIEKHWQDIIHDTIEPPVDPKTSLQEWSQEKKLGIPRYDIITKTGQDHSPEFTVQVSLQSMPAFRANANSKKAAEKAAAHLMLNFIENKYESKK